MGRAASETRLPKRPRGLMNISVGLLCAVRPSSSRTDEVRGVGVGFAVRLCGAFGAWGIAHRVAALRWSAAKCCGERTSTRIDENRLDQTGVDRTIGVELARTTPVGFWCPVTGYCAIVVAMYRVAMMATGFSEYDLGHCARENTKPSRAIVFAK